MSVSDEARTTFIARASDGMVIIFRAAVLPNKDVVDYR